MDFFYMGDPFLLLQLFIQLFIILILYQFELMHIYFILWVIFQYYFIVLLKLWPLRALSVGSYVPLTHSHQHGFCLWAFSYFLAVGDDPGISCIFPNPVPEAISSQRSYGYHKFFMYCENMQYVSLHTWKISFYL